MNLQELAEKHCYKWSDFEEPKYVMTIPQLSALIREVAGEPVAWTNQQHNYFEQVRKDTVFGSHTIPLYAIPTSVMEVLKC